jgi:hypothetical protein
MKQIFYTTILIAVFCLIGFGQEPKVVAEPIGKPFIVSGEQLENLEVPASMDRFGKIDNNLLKARLDLFTSLISPKNKTIEFVIQLRGETKQVVSKNMEFVYTYLTGKKKIEPARISFAIAPEGEEATEFWLIPNKNIAIPACKDCSIIQAEDEESLEEFFQLKKSKK